MPPSFARPASPGLGATSTTQFTRRSRLPSGTGGRAVVAQAGGLPESALTPSAAAAPALHPAAAARRAAAEARRAAYASEVALALDDQWYHAPGPANFHAIDSPAAFQAALDAAGPSTLVVAEFFVPHCPACRTLQPKLHSIAAANPDAVFLHVNGTANPALTAWVEARGVTRLPWFELIRGGAVVMGLAANLTQVSRLRAEIAAAKACEGECAVPR